MILRALAGVGGIPRIDKRASRTPRSRRARGIGAPAHSPGARADRVADSRHRRGSGRARGQADHARSADEETGHTPPPVTSRRIGDSPSFGGDGGSSPPKAAFVHLRNTLDSSRISWFAEIPRHRGTGLALPLIDLPFGACRGFLIVFSLRLVASAKSYGAIFHSLASPARADAGRARDVAKPTSMSEPRTRGRFSCARNGTHARISTGRSSRATS